MPLFRVAILRLVRSAAAAASPPSLQFEIGELIGRLSIECNIRIPCYRYPIPLNTLDGGLGWFDVTLYTLLAIYRAPESLRLYGRGHIHCPKYSRLPVREFVILEFLGKNMN